MTRPRSCPTPGRRRGLVALLAVTGPLGLVVGAAPVASAGDAVGTVPVASAGEAVGGTRLGARGIVVDPAAPALPPGVTARGWVVADADTGDVLAARDPHGRYTPASTLKVLTAVTELPRLDPNRMVTPNPSDLLVDGNKAPLDAATSYPVHDLFAYLMLRSANDAANVIASLDGSRAQTLARMNAEAHRLRADDTTAMTPNGLDETGQASSAYDLALIARAALAQPELARLVSTPRVTVTGRAGRPTTIAPENKLLLLYPGAIGVKTGYTTRSGGTFIGAARRDGHTLIVTLLHATPHYYPEAEHLLDWGFAARGRATAVGTLVAPSGPAPAAPVFSGSKAAAHPPTSADSSGAGWVGVVLDSLAALVAAVVLLRIRAVWRVRRRRAASGSR